MSYTVGEIAKKLGKSIRTIQNWDRTGKFVAKRSPSGRRYYTQEQFMALVGKKEYIKDEGGLSCVENKTVAIIGGAGFLGKRLTKKIYKSAKKIVIISRDEGKHFAMQRELPDAKNIRYLIGSVEDADRMKTALNGVDVCIMAAASKRIDSCAYNIESTIKTNVIGTLNVMHACIYNNVSKNIYISTDKVVNCQTAYGAQKMLGERIFIDGGNNYGSRSTLFSAVRYGNVLGSSKSLKTFIKEDAEKNGFVSLTKKDATRFWMTADDAVDIVLFCVSKMNGGEVFIPKHIKAASLEIFAKAFAPDFPIKEVGFKTYEKIHEELITDFEQGHTADFGKYYAILPFHARNDDLGWNRSFPEYKTINKFKFTSKDVEQLTAEELKLLADQEG